MTEESGREALCESGIGTSVMDRLSVPTEARSGTKEVEMLGM